MRGNNKKQAGFTVRQDRRGGLTFKASGGFDLRAVPELQAMGLGPPEPLEKGKPCKCGRSLPWHIFELGRLTYHCCCGISWRNTDEGKDADVRMVCAYTS